MRKLVGTGLLIFVLSTFASDGLTLRDVMQLVKVSTLKILEGFLLNNEEMIIQGAKEIANHPKPKGGPLLYIDPSKREEFKRLMASFEKTVHGGSRDIIRLVREGKKEEAFQKYTEVVRGCMACHKLFRDWR